MTGRAEAAERVLRFQRENAYSLPLNVEALCRALGLTLRPVTELARESGLGEEEIFALWGNRDGVLQRCGERYVLGYNDARPPRRRRFTICEEAAHFLLGHLDDPDFQVFRQSYGEERYRDCEEEARFAAGLLLCPPRWFFRWRDALTEAALARRCAVSPACARRILDDYARFGALIRGAPSFGFAPVNAER
ncbi:MAG: ImmA/IrrE family metallo-endopeptidase [Oscillospiraceae bacterium]|nr:ImmA/IrrE family metallo-endopeptidase [Oscillospiraceae bacterium]